MTTSPCSSLEALAQRWRKHASEMPRYDDRLDGIATGLEQCADELDAALAAQPAAATCDCAASRVLHEKTCAALAARPQEPTP